MKWSRRLFLVGAWAILLCGVGHTVGHILNMHSKPENAAEGQLMALMQSYVIPAVGRTTQSLFDGFSLTFAILPVTMGFLCMAVAGSSDLRLRKKVALIAAIAMIVESAVSLKYWFAGPTTFLIVAALAFSASWMMTDVKSAGPVSS